MFDKLIEAQKKAEEIKNRLDTILVSAEVENGKISVTSTANKSLTAIHIDPQLLAGDNEQLEELLITAINKALQQAEQVSQTEMQAATRDMMGGLGNLFGK
jgi:hypothetical protein